MDGNDWLSWICIEWFIKWEAITHNASLLDHEGIVHGILKFAWIQQQTSKKFLIRRAHFKKRYSTYKNWFNY